MSNVIMGQIKEMALENVAADPAAGKVGRVIYNTTNSLPKYDNGTNIVNFGVGMEVQDFTLVGSVGDALQQRAGHIWIHTDLDSELPTWATLAYYRFANGALTTDDTGVYALTNINAATNTTGILNTNFATALAIASTQYYYQVSLLDIVSTLSNGIVVAGWFKCTDGQEVASQTIFNKENRPGTDTMMLSISTSGVISFVTEENNNGATPLYSNIVLPNGATDWHFFCAAWDTTNGKTLIIDDDWVVDTAETTLMRDDIGTHDTFTIGAFSTPAAYFGGSLAQIIIADALITPRAVDWLKATLIPEPAAITGLEYSLVEKIRPEADADFEYQEPCQVVFKQTFDDTNSYIGKKGFGNSPTDTVKIVAQVGG